MAPPTPPLSFSENEQLTIEFESAPVTKAPPRS
jgi:hypothetical protein